MSKLLIKGAKEHNLKDIDLELPHEAFICVIGVSGAGKSTLVFDVIGTEGQRKLVESLMPSLKYLLGPVKKPEVDSIEGIRPPVFVTRTSRPYGPRSTVGTVTEIYDLLRVMFAKEGEPFCPICGRSVRGYSKEEMAQRLFSYQGRELMILVPVRKGEPIERYLREGFVKAWISGEIVELERLREGPFDLMVDRLLVKEGALERIRESLEIALGLSKVVKFVLDEGETDYMAVTPYCPMCEFLFPPINPSLFSFNHPEGACPSCKGLGVIGERICVKCGGKRLRKEALSVKLGGWDISSLCELKVITLKEVVEKLPISSLLEGLRREVEKRVELLNKIGLGYLSLNRSMDSLSHGEVQRVRLASQLGMKLSGVMYLVEEPTSGLHPYDQKKVIKVLKELKELGNTVVIVEHNPRVILESDWIVELGPGPGDSGGRVLYCGPLSNFLQLNTPTCLYVRSNLQSRKRSLRSPSGWLTVKRARKHNLKGIDAKIPLGVLCCLIGVSGSGKSTLAIDVLAKGLKRKFRGLPPEEVDEIVIEGEVKKVVVVEQGLFNKDPRSVVATYIGVFKTIRELFAQTFEARLRGWGPSRFSFNLKGGRCERCKGTGKARVEFEFLAELEVICEHCSGTRYEEEVLEVKFRGLNIAQVLSMTIEEALVFFKNFPPVVTKLEPLSWAGLSYLKLGQPLANLSVGEAQRLKMAKYWKVEHKGVLYILDEPSNGLHPSEVERILEVFDNFIEGGGTVLAIDHNPYIVGEADYIIELGPGAGDEGGKIISEGTLEDLKGHIFQFYS